MLEWRKTNDTLFTLAHASETYATVTINRNRCSMTLSFGHETLELANVRDLDVALRLKCLKDLNGVTRAQIHTGLVLAESEKRGVFNNTSQ